MGPLRCMSSIYRVGVLDGPDAGASHSIPDFKRVVISSCDQNQVSGGITHCEWERVVGAERWVEREVRDLPECTKIDFSFSRISREIR